MRGGNAGLDTPGWSSQRGKAREAQKCERRRGGPVRHGAAREHESLRQEPPASDPEMNISEFSDSYWARLEQAEESLRAIRTGEVEALTVDDPLEPQVFIPLEGLARNRVESQILADVHDAVIAVDAQRHVTYLNAAAERQYEVSACEVLGHDLDEIYQRAQDDPSATPGPTAHESLEHHVHIKRSGVAIHVESAVAGLLDENGQPSGQLRVIRDVTDGGLLSS